MRSYLPRRSTTQACCCGTILSVCTTKMIAMTATTSATSMGPALFLFSSSIDASAVAAGSSTSQLPSTARMTCSPGCGGDSGREPGGPDRAAMLHARGAVGGPGVDVHVIADVEVHVAIRRGGRLDRLARARASARTRSRLRRRSRTRRSGWTAATRGAPRSRPPRDRARASAGRRCLSPARPPRPCPPAPTRTSPATCPSFSLTIANR